MNGNFSQTKKKRTWFSNIFLIVLRDFYKINQRTTWTFHSVLLGNAKKEWYSKVPFLDRQSGVSVVCSKLSFSKAFEMECIVILLLCSVIAKIPAIQPRSEIYTHVLQFHLDKREGPTIFRTFNFNWHLLCNCHLRSI